MSCNVCGICLFYVYVYVRCTCVSDVRVCQVYVWVSDIRLCLCKYVPLVGLCLVYVCVRGKYVLAVQVCFKVSVCSCFLQLQYRE